MYHHLNQKTKPSRRYALLVAVILVLAAMAIWGRVGDGSIQGSPQKVRVAYDLPILVDGGLIFMSEYLPWEPEEKPGYFCFR